MLNMNQAQLYHRNMLGWVFSIFEMYDSAFIIRVRSYPSVIDYIHI